MQPNECMYCNPNERLNFLMSPLTSLPSAVVYLFKSDTDFPGRCVVALDTHETEIFHLDSRKRTEFLESVTRVAEAVQKATEADKINYGIYGDTMSHLHVHIVPKHKDGPEWGKTFTMNRGDAAVAMTQEEIASWKKRIGALLLPS